MKMFKTVFVVLAVFVGDVFCSRADLLKDNYYGPGPKKADDVTIKPLNITVPYSVLEDLKNRLKNARITHTQLEDQKNFHFGFSLKALNEFKDYWLNEYDWRKVEEELTRFPSFKTEIEGVGIHFIHAKPPAGKYKTVKPLLASHGWPGSIHEFTKALPIFTDPQANGINVSYAFEVITPSIPGYGWSDAAQKSGLNQASAARIYNKLMTRLNFTKYFVQGGDWGSTIVGNMARLYPQNVQGAHLNMLVSLNPAVLAKTTLYSARPVLLKEAGFKGYSVARYINFAITQAGYFHQQMTQPDTVGIALNDSPIGVMAWILEKFSGGTNPAYEDFEDGHLTKRFTKEDLITAVMIYWVNGNMLQSARFYKELFISKDAQNLMSEFITVPTGYAACLNDAVPAQPKDVASAAVNLQHYSTIDAGHFAAMEKPLELVKDVFEFTKPLVK
ncbi:unnamed protein product [Bursaphelenchus xylophilus]|uniref:Epoxide hydrolase n=1 Tax=Bursaphelenchus xylophilus TaxID=6326 RepID=A0A1I7RMJ6_BURXY|nr:unnamed protein product [Bursaphelenchus xylophilus]CAG9125758.1 unnamed protein product [Bursaphelenchus xylophilus]